MTIAGKEVRVFGTTWTAYILFICFVEICGFFFYLLVRDFQVLRLQYAEMRAMGMLEQMNLTDLVVGRLFPLMATVLIFLTPILTMRLIAGERRGRTLELLMTVPVRPIEIVLGKYFAALGLVVGMVGITAAFPLALHLLGDAPGVSPLDWRTVAAGYLGLFMLGGALVAIGMLTSAVTDSQIIAAVLAVAANLVLFFIGVAAHGQEGIWPGLVGHLSISNHLDGFSRGLLRATDITYFVSLAFVGLLLTYRVVEAQRWR